MYRGVGKPDEDADPDDDGEPAEEDEDDAERGKSFAVFEGNAL